MSKWAGIVAIACLLAGTSTGIAQNSNDHPRTFVPQGATAQAAARPVQQSRSDQVYTVAGLPLDSTGPVRQHHHLLIDNALDQPIPNDFYHLHFGAGQTEADITLKPGTHTLQLLLGDKDHIPHNPPVMSPRIRIVVMEEGTVPKEAASPESTRRRTQAQNTRKRYRSSRRVRSY